MFNIFKRKAKLVTESDFDVLQDFTFNGVTFTKAEVSLLLMLWSQSGGSMLMVSLSQMVLERCAEFQQKYASSPVHEKTAFARVYANGLIEHLKKQKLIKRKGSKYAGSYKITERGEQIRQFYILKNGLGRSIYSRMDKFEAA